MARRRGAAADRAGREGVDSHVRAPKPLGKALGLALVLASGLLLPRPAWRQMGSHAGWTSRSARWPPRTSGRQTRGGCTRWSRWPCMTRSMASIPPVNVGGSRPSCHRRARRQGRTRPGGGRSRTYGARRPAVWGVGGRESELDAALEADIAAAGGLGHPGVVDGRDWGVSVGQQVVSQRATDGTQSAETIPAGSGCGLFAPVGTRAGAT